ncbi:MAG: alanyl-tRNA synthetase [Gaiellales bacterium]|jgi:alanyl-tRNA synthetase|nr:alanyl-tRNA synthetase [Gaiellales bacterium]MDX6598530.1 alanyl-tRNA synthetase [Gaiellales bacterium]
MGSVRTSDEIRRAFTDFFVERGHVAVPSASLVPSALDQSVLLTTAGMQPFKPYFLGQAKPPAPRLTSVQRCFRAVDIDVVGSTERHMTFFQMMGNFSFGDYFKEGAVEMAYELSTGPYGLDPERIWATIYEGDDQIGPDEVARDLWIAQGIPASRILALGEDNFWKAGPTGPCGPCSELFYDRGPQHGCGGADCNPACGCDRFLEFWNLVFMEFDRGADGSLTPLPAQNIDTGSGLERVAMLLQDAPSIYETDQTTHVIEAIERLSGRRYADGGDAVRSFRVLCDHGRGMAAIATDGVTPSNEGRGYVLRRIIRRAVLHGSRLGIETPFLGAVHQAVIESLADGYPELVEHRDEVRRLLESEEERFSQTLATGSRLLDDLIARARDQGESNLHAGDVFELHDTHGFPVEMTAELAREAGLGIDLEGFEGHMQAQRERARAAARRGDRVDDERVARFALSAPRSDFVGYDRTDVETEVLAVEPVAEGLTLVKLARSPFYPEGGGQVSDSGEISAHAVRGQIESAYRLDGDQALLVRLDGELSAGDTVHARVDAARHRATMANHTGTHLLQRALRNQLGEHVRQAGSAVRPEGLRFDFTHPAPLSAEELRAVEDEVNRVVLEDHELNVFETSQDEARSLGATMLFGEKYGDVVRVVDITGYSMELCGGTHVRSTAAVGPFTIVRESSVGQGVRRIEAITGPEALGALRRADRSVKEAAAALRTPPEKLPEAVAALSDRVRELEKAAKAGGGSPNGGAPDLAALTAGAAERGRLKVLVVEAPAGILGDSLLELADRLRGALGPSAVVLGARDGERVQLVASMTPEAVEDGLDASAVIKAIGPIVGGGGGGRPAMARAGGKDASRLDEALDAARSLLSA